jgi:hypothetical protein
MLTTNQVPFIKISVGYTIQLVMKGSSICCTKGCTTQI